MATLVFLSCASEDVAHRDELRKHFGTLRRTGVVDLWHDGLVPAGEDRDAAARAQLDAAAIILLLVSADYLDSDACREEMERALDRARGGVRVVPVLLRPCSYGRDRIAGLTPLPVDGRPVTAWTDRDAAWTDVADGVAALLGEAPAAPDTSGAAEEPRGPKGGAATEGAADDAAADQDSRLDDATIQVLARLEDARARKRRLVEAGAPTREIDDEVLSLKRQLREGGQVRQGDLLGGRYSLLRRRGRGGFATVWEAEDREERRRVAVKVLHSELAGDPRRRERFFRGARVMSELRHEAIVRVFSAREEDGRFHFFVMELLSGSDLQTAVLSGRVRPVDAVPLILRVGDALAAAHDRGFIHRDVKPANILLDDEGNPKLSDFDLVGGKDTTGGTGTGAMGTFVYAAPEMLDRPQDADRRADVFGLGMTALFCLHGDRLPQSVFFNPISVIGGLRSMAVARVIARAIARAPEQRYEDARAFCEALRQAQEEGETAPEAHKPSFAQILATVGTGLDLIQPGAAAALRAASSAVAALSDRTATPTSPAEPPEVTPKARPAEPPALADRPSPFAEKPPAHVAKPSGDAKPPRSEPAKRLQDQGTSIGSMLVAIVALIAAAAGAWKLQEQIKKRWFPDPDPFKMVPVALSSGAPIPPVSMLTATATVAASAMPPGKCPDSMVAIVPEGPVWIGSKEGVGESDERPRHQVTLKPYCMDRTEVTVAAYAWCVMAKRCGPLDSPEQDCNLDKVDRQDHPINCVTWFEAQVYCRQAGKRLPSEEEWEFAARGPDERPYPWGEKTPSNQLCWDGSGKDSGPTRRVTTCKVGAYPKGDSPSGLSDMAGNLQELTASFYCPYPSKDCPATLRVVRSSSWGFSLEQFVRVADRRGFAADARSGSIGFRCARDL